MASSSPVKPLTLLLVALVFLAGCLGGGTDVVIDVGDSDTPDGEGGNGTGGDGGEGDPPAPIAVSQTAGCDNLNPIHCMLPFPSDAFLIEDSTTVTGLRVNYQNDTLPVSGSVESVNIPGLNRFDGMSPSTQIMTAFTTIANLTGVADQHTIAISLEDGHATILLNLDTGARVAHWVENDARQSDDNQTLIFIRTIQGLEPNTNYGVGISGLGVSPSPAFQAILAGVETDASDVEARRASLDSLITTLESEGHDRASLVAAWSFHTASMGSILGGTLQMRSDALERLGDDGIGCTVNSVDNPWDDDDRAFRRIRGTFTAPQYLESLEPPTLMSRDANGTPSFVQNGEVPFTLVIPQVLVDNNRSGPLIVFGHGFLGNGEGAVSGSGIGWNDEFEASFIATDIIGWSMHDIDTIAFGLFDPSYFENQANRLQQMLVNQMAMVRTFKGVCSDLEVMHHNGTNLVNTSDVHYMGYSLGGIYGASITAFSPDIDRAALWVGGSGFSYMIERSTNYYRFEEGFMHPQAYPERNDRALLVAVCQQMWDASDPDIWLRFAAEGYGNEIGPFEILSIISVNDAQVPGLVSDRAARNAGIPVLDSSARLPYGINTAVGPITGSAVVYWDGGYPTMPEDNSPPPVEQASKAHNEIAPIVAVNEMVEIFLNTGVIVDTCDTTCTFDYEAESAAE